MASNVGLRGNRDFRLLWIGGLFSSFGAHITIVALPLLVLRLTGSAAQAGLVGTVGAVAMLVTMFPAGVLVDMAERRTVALLAEIVAVADSIALCLIAGSGNDELLPILVLSAVGGVLTAFGSPAATALVKAVVPEEAAPAAAARLQARSAAAKLAGPLIGGVLLSVHPVAPFLTEALCLAVSVLCLSSVRVRTRSAGGTPSGLNRKEMTAGFAFIWGHPRMRLVLLVFGAGVNMAFGALTFAALTTLSQGGRSTVDGGFFVTMSAAGSLLGALIAPACQSRTSFRGQVAATAGVCAATSFVMTSSPGPLLAGISIAVASAIGAVASVAFLTVLLVVTPADMLGRVQTAAGLLSSIAQPAGPLAAGVLMSLWGETWAFAAIGVVFAACVLASRSLAEPA